MKKYKTQWDLALLYKSPKDPQIEKDIQSIEKLCDTLAKKYKDKKFIQSPELLYSALEDIEKTASSVNESKPLFYFWLQTELNSSDAIVKAALQSTEQRLTVAGNKLIFFELTVASISLKDQKKFLEYPKLKKYKYLLEKTFLLSKFNLSEKEEQLLGLLSQPSFSMWTQATDQLLHKKTVLFKKKNIPISEATDILPDLSTKDRLYLYKEIVRVCKDVASIAEPELNAIGTYKKIVEQQRGFEAPYQSQMISHELDEGVVSALVSLTTKYFSVSKKFYSLHKKLLNLSSLGYQDRSAHIGKVKKKFSFDEAVSIVKNSFSSIDQKYVLIFEKFLKDGQIDVYPRKGKKGGGFCASVLGTPTFILLNYTKDIRSVETIAHEMGHAFHIHFSKTQPPHYSHYPMSTAEVASTFFENGILDILYEKLSTKEKIVFLHSKLLSDITTVFRQIACFNFENEFHITLKQKGYLSSVEIQKIMIKHMSAYLGPSFKLTEDDGLDYVRWMHLRMFFYTISYTFGFLVSKALYENYKKDPLYIKKVEQFLSSGASMSPKDIFKKMGIDITDPKFFESGLKAIDADITKLEKLAKKAKLI
ncbi:MAG: M3 family metallopeptidase [Patescibacteria group bacterium]